MTLLSRLPSGLTPLPPVSMNVAVLEQWLVYSPIVLAVVAVAAAVLGWRDRRHRMLLFLSVVWGWFAAIMESVGQGLRTSHETPALAGWWLGAFAVLALGAVIAGRRYTRTVGARDGNEAAE